jgi:hypothetical protein
LQGLCVIVGTIASFHRLKQRCIDENNNGTLSLWIGKEEDCEKKKISSNSTGIANLVVCLCSSTGDTILTWRTASLTHPSG